MKRVDETEMEAGQGKAKGGVARARALSPVRRSEIARTAARARHGILPKATHKGNFKEEFGFDVECYVLDDDQKTAVISQRGMGATLGLGEGGSRLTRFVKRNKMAPYVGPELARKLSIPLIFQWSAPGLSVPPSVVNGYDVTILIDVCKAITKAAGAGVPIPKNALTQANVIVGASAKLGIKNLVYALAGYDATREETIAAYKFYVREEAREYEKEFPDELYAEWYRLYRLPKPEKNRPWKFRQLTIDHVYKPLARSNGKVLNLTRSKRHEAQAPSKKLHQFLSEIGVKALRMHLGRLLGMAQVSDEVHDYERFVNKVFGVQPELDFGQEHKDDEEP